MQILQKIGELNYKIKEDFNMNIQLPTGTTISVNYFEYLFILEDSQVDLFFQECIADNLGTFIENPFSRMDSSKIEIDEEEEDQIKELK